MGERRQVNGDRRSLVSKRVLVLDQSMSVRELLRAILEDSGAEVEIVCSAHHVVDHATRFRPHAVLMDVTHFGVESAAVVTALRSLPDLQLASIIAMAPTALYPEPHSMTQAGFTAVFPKPITPSRLRHMLVQQLSLA